MIYLGAQLEAKAKFTSRVYCWLNIKLYGKNSRTNPLGYECTSKNCITCKKKLRILSGVVVFSTFIKPHLTSILEANPDEMISLENFILQDWQDQGLGTNDQFNEYCSEIFKIRGYDRWFIKDSINYELAEWLGQDTCTFCNRQYIFTARKSKGKKGITCQYDHWLDKASHPLFALSFYNLIPSCSVCNSSVKSTASFNTSTHLHPYLDANISNAFSFSYKLNKYSDYEITFADENNLKEKTKRTLDDLGTKLVYKNHSQKELKDLIDLRKKYSDNYLNILLEKTFGDLQISEEERYRLIFGIEINESNYHKRPMSKFKKDIITELRSIDNKS